VYTCVCVCVCVCVCERERERERSLLEGYLNFSSFRACALFFQHVQVQII